MDALVPSRRRQRALRLGPSWTEPKRYSGSEESAESKEIAEAEGPRSRLRTNASDAEIGVYENECSVLYYTSNSPPEYRYS